MPINDHEQFLYLSVAIAAEASGARRWQGVYSAYLERYLVDELPRPSQAKAALCLLYERYPECKSEAFDIRIYDDANSEIYPDLAWEPEPDQVLGVVERVNEKPDHTPLSLAD
ncbi:hypothetical protein [Cupriavidus pauculus]|uniref:hypothetical protein n=1 Tax=Cupriavidus pauculus TaxID=82633 RepID=UPI0012484788|nr:hypothetical protein [Cupriavidus pauculus]KAB0598493.1 hypothetical protein F7R19_25460 [Cupriavidus pauculus]MBY4731456.1 hypothetical protein [Cupriavidus pauculus]UAL00457.1 hypothetical protein K8O84_03550 [Cupriavidus pauculus]